MKKFLFIVALTPLLSFACEPYSTFKPRIDKPKSILARRRRTFNPIKRLNLPKNLTIEVEKDITQKSDYIIEDTPTFQAVPIPEKRPQLNDKQKEALLSPTVWQQLLFCLFFNTNNIGDQVIKLAQDYNPKLELFGTGEDEKNKKLIELALSYFESKRQFGKSRELQELCVLKKIPLPGPPITSPPQTMTMPLLCPPLNHEELQRLLLQQGSPASEEKCSDYFYSKNTPPEIGLEATECS